MQLFRLLFLYFHFLNSVFATTYVIDDSQTLGRQFDGIGGISGGGATSKLLINYPEPQRSEILDYLFKPNFGASLHILKVEIGGDGQSSDGSEASHMHNSYEENYERGYEWWLMVQAKKRNPNIRIYGLPWSYPGWLNPTGKRDPYTDPQATSGYIIKWINGASTHYNVTVDYIGIWNEKHYDKVYIKTLRRELDKAGLKHVRIVAPDAPHINDWKICPDMLNDPELAAAIDVVGCHYPGTITTPAAIETGKPLWASEDYSTFNDLVGGGCWARILNQNYVNGNITGTLSWNLIAAYYDTFPWTRDGLMTAESPWSGHYVVESPIWMAAHTTQFVQIGWHYYRHGYGSGHLKHGGSYVSLISPNRKDLTVVIETMSHDHSKCVRPFLPPFSVGPQNVTFKLIGTFAAIDKLYLWKSTYQYDGKPSTFFEKQTPVKVTQGTFSLTLEVDEVVTVTTLSTGAKGSHPDPPPAEDFPLPYIEDFEKYKEHEEPYNFAQQMGSFEVMDTGEGNGKVMRQMVTQIPIYWCTPELLDMSINLIGSQKWTDIAITTEVQLPKVNSSDGYFVAARVAQGGCHMMDTSGIFLFIYPHKQKYLVTGDLAKHSVLKQGSTGPVEALDWNTLHLSVQNGTAMGLLNTRKLFTIPLKSKQLHGFVGVGTTSWGHADFDNVHISKP